MPSPTAEPSCFVEPARTSPAANTPGMVVSMVVVVTRNPPAIALDRLGQEVGVGREADEHEGGRRRKALGLPAVAVAGHHGRESPTLPFELDDVHAGVHDELGVAAHPLLENRRSRQVRARQHPHPIGELREVQALFERRIPPPITTTSSAPL